MLEDLLETFDEQQHNHEQELDRLQSEAKEWEKVAQNYEDVIVTQRSAIKELTSLKERIMLFAQMTPLQAGQAFAKWLFGSKTDEVREHCSSYNGVIAAPEYRFCPHCGSDRQSLHTAQNA